MWFWLEVSFLNGIDYLGMCCVLVLAYTVHASINTVEVQWRALSSMWGGAVIDELPQTISSHRPNNSAGAHRQNPGFPLKISLRYNCPARLQTSYAHAPTTRLSISDLRNNGNQERKDRRQAESDSDRNSRQEDCKSPHRKEGGPGLNQEVVQRRRCFRRQQRRW